MSAEPLSGPARVQIQTQSGCNGRCVFCPNREVVKSDLPQGRMPVEVFRKIVDELAELRPRRISPYLMNEPLLDSRLPELVRYITQKVPGAASLVTSNGTHLTEELGRALIDADLKRLKISLQSLDSEVNKGLMGGGCDADVVVKNVLTFQRLLKETRASGVDLRVSMIVTKANADEIERARKFWKRHGIRLVTSALENRGGNIADACSMNPDARMLSRKGCLRPSREMCILWNGDVVLCCVDWWRTVIVGNVARQSVREVWHGPQLKGVRAALARDDSGALPRICVNCAESAAPDAHRRGLKRLFQRWIGRP